jgi:tRNA (guanosine-2'-O-)-methyltransferase
VSISDERQARVRNMLAGRLGSVVVILEAVHRRHNVSAIMRSCECFGVHEVHLITDGFRPSKGAARGSERWLDIHRYTETAPAIKAVKERGFQVFVADLVEGSFSPDTVPIDQPTAILMGAELTGVSDEARRLADGAICVPMHGLTESLNVSVAAACILQRVTDRRRAVADGGDLEESRQDAFFEQWFEWEVQLRQGMIARSREDR